MPSDGACAQRAAGRIGGRLPALAPSDKERARKWISNRIMTRQEAAKALGVARSTLARAAVAVAILAASAAASVGEPEFCVSMRRPYVLPTDEEVAEYRDLIIADFEAYMSDVTRYFTCLDRERDRAMREVREVGEEYSAFLDKAAR